MSRRNFVDMFDADKTDKATVLWKKNYDNTLCRFHTIPKRNRQTDGQTDRFAVWLWSSLLEIIRQEAPPAAHFRRPDFLHVASSSQSTCESILIDRPSSCFEQFAASLPLVRTFRTHSCDSCFTVRSGHALVQSRRRDKPIQALPESGDQYVITACCPFALRIHHEISCTCWQHQRFLPRLQHLSNQYSR